MSRTEDGFEEYNLDNESFEEKVDIEPIKVSDLTKKLSEWNIQKVPLKDHSILKTRKVKSLDLDNIRNLIPISESVNSPKSVSFRDPPSESFRDLPSESFRDPPSEIGFEDYIVEATRRALASVRNQSLPRKDSIGALSDLTDEGDYYRESTLSNIRLSEYTLERILRSCENNFNFLQNILSQIEESDFDTYVSQLFRKKGGMNHLPRHNEPVIRPMLEDIDMSISDTSIPSINQRSILSPPNIKTPSPPGIEVRRPIAIRVAASPSDQDQFVGEDSIRSFIEDTPRMPKMDRMDEGGELVEIPHINPEIDMNDWEKWVNKAEPGRRELTDDARERTDNIANIISTSILKNVEDDLKNEEEHAKLTENESKRLVAANTMVSLNPDLTIKISNIPNNISPTNYENLRQSICLMYANHLINRGNTKELAIKISSKYLDMSEDDFIAKDKTNEIQKALFARVYESLIGIGKLNQLYSFLEMYNIYIAYLKTYHFIKDKIIEASEKEEHIQKISNLNSEMEKKIKSADTMDNTHISYEKMKDDIRYLEKEVINLQEYLTKLGPEKKEKMKDDYEDAEEALGTIAIRITIFMKSIANPIRSNINPKVAELFLLNPMSKIFSSILIATKELSKSFDNFYTSKLEVGDVSIFGIDVYVLGLVLPPNISNYSFPNHNAALLWLMTQLIISLYYTKTWMIAMMGYTSEAIGIYLMSYMSEILNILKEWKKDTQSSLENWMRMIEYGEKGSSIENETIIHDWMNQMIGNFGDYVDEITHVRQNMIVTAAVNIQNLGKFAPPKSKELLNVIIQNQ